jgi:hypothetical protein
MLRVSNMIPEEEFQYKGDKSPSLGGGFITNKISAIGMFDEGTDRKDSPFWDHENAFEIQKALDVNPFSIR